jgi:hypothetical protein
MRTFGIEIEFNTTFTARPFIDALAARGITCEAGNYTTRNRRAIWLIKPDGSIGVGHELVSPVMTLDEVAYVLPLVTAAIKEVDPSAKCSEKCGLHVHMGGFGSLEFQAVRNVVRRYINFEDTLDAMQPAHRRGDNSYYTRSNVGHFSRQFASRAQALEAVWDKVQRASNRGDLIRLFCGDSRYWKVNLHSLHVHGTIEVRHAAGSIDGAEIVNWVRFLAAFTEVAVTQQRLHKRPAMREETQSERVAKLTRAMPSDLKRWVKSRINANA